MTGNLRQIWQGIRSSSFEKRVIVFTLSAFLITRLILILSSGRNHVQISLWPMILFKGLIFDLAVLTYVLVPFVLIRAITPSGMLSSRMKRGIQFLSFGFLSLLILIVSASELIFWQEFSTRFNFIAVDYLLYTHEVIGNIRQSYPMGLILSGIVSLAGGVTWVCLRGLKKEKSIALTKSDRLSLLGVALVILSVSHRDVRIEMMDGLGNQFADELSGNGIFTFFAALQKNELDYDRFYRGIPQADADAILQAQEVERVPLLRILDRTGRWPAETFDKVPFKKRPTNVVLISIESLSASFVGAYGGRGNLTPNLDRLIGEGLKFERLFATGTRTVRGLEALSLGTPPVPGQAIVRRPKNEHLQTLGEMLHHQGFATYFIYGGYGYFDNMNAYFKGNDYHVIDRTDFPARTVPFENIWGVADEALFDNSLPALDQAHAKGKRFFAHIMTTSNHRPFTYPDGRIDILSPGGRDGAVKYTDYAVGKFIEDARKRPWFSDTLFVITADHCASVAGHTKLPVNDYRIPMVFYAPSLLKPGAFQQIVSQIDIPPTLLESLRVEGDDHFFGRSIFEESGPANRAFISNYQELGYYKNDRLTVLSPQQKVSVFRVDPRSLDSTPAEVDPELLREAIAYYQTASRAFKLGALSDVP